MENRTYRELFVWQKAMDLVEAAYYATGKFPKEESYGLTIQFRRAAASIPSTIAEAQGRETVRDFLRFLWMSLGPLREVEAQVMIAERLNQLEPRSAPDLLHSTGEVGRLRSLKNLLPPE